LDNEPVVFVVAGDSKTRRALTSRLKTLDLPATVCRSADEFLQAYAPATPGVLLLDVSHPATDFEILIQLGQQANHLPVIGISSLCDVPTAVMAMKLGAMDYLSASCSDELLGNTIEQAFLWDADHRRHIAMVESIRRRLARLTPGHREVLELLVAGKANREIAAELDLSVRSIEVRRAKIMSTMRAKSLADLVRQTIMFRGIATGRRTDSPPEIKERSQRPDFSPRG
jgi:FixJ family two-component response regulator